MPPSPAPTAEDRAILRLLLRRGRDYEQIAAALAADAAGVRERAHAALAALVPFPATLDEAAHARLADRLLTGGGPPAPADAAERDWWTQIGARLVAEDLADPGRSVSVPAARDLRVSRRGGLLIIAVAALAAALAVFAALGGFSSGKPAADAGRPAPAATATGTTATTATTGAVITKQINLRAPGGGRTPLGVALVIEQDGTRALQVLGQGLAPGNMYALWWRRGDRWSRLGFFPAVSAKGSDAGRLTGLVAAPQDILKASRIVVSRETSQAPSSPAEIVLAGTVAG